MKYGLETSIKKAVTVDELPEIIKKMGAQINEKGSVTVIAHYIKANADYDGETKTYRWIQGEKMLESWKIAQENTQKKKNNNG